MFALKAVNAIANAQRAPRRTAQGATAKRSVGLTANVVVSATKLLRAFARPVRANALALGLSKRAKLAIASVKKIVAATVSVL